MCRRFLILYSISIGCRKRKFPTIEEKTAAVKIWKESNTTLAEAAERSGVPATTIRRHHKNVSNKAQINEVTEIALLNVVVCLKM